MVQESKYTGPNPLCKNPDRWHSPDADATEFEVTELVASLVRALQPELVIETGTYLGHTAQAIGDALRKNGHGRLITLEINPEYIVAARERIVGLPVEILEINSMSFMPPGPVGFAWFDSAPEARVLEYLRYEPMLERIVGFHDTGPQHNIRPSIEHLEKAGHIKPIFLPTPRGMCIAEVLRR